MSRLSSFFLGALVGAGLLYVVTNYHVVQADDGFHVIPKTNAGFKDIYVDIREFTIGDWADHQGLAVAITNAGKQHLLADSAGNTLNQGLQNLQQQLQPPQ